MLVSRVHETPGDVSDVAAGRLSSYSRLFAVRGLRRLAVADLCARLPQGMLSITVVLVAAQHASMRVAGLALAGSTFGLAATAPVRGRLADRYGIARIAVFCCVGYLAAWLGLLTASLARQPPAVLVALAVMSGCCTPPLSPGLRSLWSWQAPAQLLHTAFALDAAVFDLAYILGPVIASALAVGITPAVALAVLLALTGSAVIIIGPRSQREASPATNATGTGPLRSAALRRLLVTAALANAALSATEVALIALVRLHHALWASGPLLAELSAGSILGSLLLGTRPSASSSQRRLSRLLTGYTLGLAALTAAGLAPLLLAVVTPVAGLCLGPTLATLFTAAADAAPDGNGIEAQSWLNSMMNGGAAVGAALAGLTASQPVLGLALATATAAAAALSAVVIRPDKKPRPPMATGASMGRMPDDDNSPGATFADPPGANDYDSFAEAYSADNEVNLFNAYYERPATLALAGDVAGRRILDAGCGSGPLFAALRDQGAVVSGFDASARMLELARKRLGDNADLQAADLGRPLPYPDGAFDDVIASLVLHYLEDWTAPLTELRRVLRPGGRLIVSVNHPVHGTPLAGPDADYFGTYQWSYDNTTLDGHSYTLTNWHRPLHAMTDAFTAASFRIAVISEPPPAPGTPRELLPDSFKDKPAGTAFLCFLFFVLQAD
jgi:SAM-dependent methyltransferase/predicted MFS family arabinose efflux permease